MSTKPAGPENARVVEQGRRGQPFLDVAARHFQKECVRLRSLEPMKEYHELVAQTHDILNDLKDRYGFDRAEDKLATEFRLARQDALDAWRGIWKDFQENRRSERDLHNLLNDPADRGEALKIYQDCERIALLNAGPEFEEVNDAMMRAADAMLKVPKELRPRRLFGPEWIMLWIRLAAFRVFVTYGLARMSFLVIKHLRITLFAVLGAGFAYGIVGGWGAEGAARLLPPAWSIWVLGVGMLGVGLVKQYWLSDKVKTYLKNWERRQLFSLALQLNVVRVMALVFRTGKIKVRLAGTDTEQ